MESDLLTFSHSSQFLRFFFGFFFFFYIPLLPVLTTLSSTSLCEQQLSLNCAYESKVCTPSCYVSHSHSLKDRLEKRRYHRSWAVTVTGISQVSVSVICFHPQHQQRESQQFYFLVSKLHKWLRLISIHRHLQEMFAAKEITFVTCLLLCLGKCFFLLQLLDRQRPYDPANHIILYMMQL